MYRLKPSPSDLFRSSFRSILKNKGRTFLTSLGIIIGVTSVILLVSIGNGLKSFVNDQFESLGSNIIFVAPGKILNSRGQFNADVLPTVSFDQKDLSKLKQGLGNRIKYIYPASQALVKVKFNQNQEEGTLVATSADYAAARNQYPVDGRWFTAAEDDKKAKVAVLGDQIATDLFGNIPPLNRRININGKNIRIIGVMDKIGGGFGGPSFDNYIYMPLSTGFDIIGNEKIQAIQMSVVDKDKVGQVKNEVKQIMLKRYQEEEFSVFDQSQILSSINTILSTLTTALAGIAAISLVVGGIGIMNIMLVTVTERTREIGLRKAIGAYPRAILLQFLFEATILSVLGGGIGILLGSLGTLAINNFFPAKVTLGSISLAFGVSFIVGIVFGVTPARRASKLSPIEALRYE